ncbi:hypothetical protein N656DRAFT_799316 [Canariomyces notabilis]|uniref:Uncharacterized protein n=1 Tax=Canariomyces notabilis TaxID=2074819 RepID=A0AAN6TBT8_9PEZI|nr:hypothetical protein N656DRAFT_799316 [Canariomyces arenarius]
MDHFLYRPLLAATITAMSFVVGCQISLSYVTLAALLGPPHSVSEDILLQQFRTVFWRGFRLCPVPAFFATLCCLVNAALVLGHVGLSVQNFFQGRVPQLLLVAVLAVGLVPYTLIFVVPVEEPLLKREAALRGNGKSVRACAKKYGDGKGKEELGEQDTMTLMRMWTTVLSLLATTMDVYTAPPENTYRTLTLFSFPTESGTVLAISTKASQYAFIAAVYTIVIQLWFAFLWQVAAEMCLIRRPRCRQEWLAMVAIRNASEPWTASWALLGSMFKLLASRNENDRRGLGVTALLSVPTVVLAAGGIVTALLYTESMRLGNAAPVSPSSVFVPDASTSTGYQLSSYYQASILRALGSAESADDSTRRSSVSVSKHGLPSPSPNTTNQPAQRISYGYTVSAYELGIQKLADFAIQVEGSCVTDPSLSFFALTDTSVGSVLDTTNQTYALVATTALLGSFTPSGDPWYFTELATGGSTVAYETAGPPYRVAPGRPVLSCWEDMQFCLGKETKRCSDLWTSGLPKGLIGHLSISLAIPMIVTIGSGAGVSALKAYSGVGAGMFLDATSSNMFADVERMVLAAFLATKEILRDSALLGRLPGTTNLLEKPDGTLWEGAADFIIRTSDVVAIRFDLAVLAPVATVVALLAVLSIEAYKRLRGLKNSPWALRSILLYGTQLFRLFDTRESNSAWEIESTKAQLPILECSESAIPELEPVWNDSTGACIITATPPRQPRSPQHSDEVSETTEHLLHRHPEEH